MLEPTMKMDVIPVTMSPFIKFNILDFSGSYDLKDPSPPELSALAQCGVMIFVFDVLVEPYKEGVKYFVDAMNVM
jgi:Ras-related GTP-binding protein C/D